MRFVLGLIQGVAAVPVLCIGVYLLIAHPWHHLFLWGFSFAVFSVIATGLFCADKLWRFIAGEEN